MTAQVFLAAFLGCLFAIEIHVLFQKTVIAPYEKRRAEKLAQKAPRIINVPADEVDLVTKMLDADQKLKIAALDFGERTSRGSVPDEVVNQLELAALEFAEVMPEDNKARIREHHAFTIEGRS